MGEVAVTSSLMETELSDREFLNNMLMTTNLVQAVGTAAELGVVDFLHKRDSEGEEEDDHGATAEEIAKALALDGPTLHRVLRMACCSGVFSMDAHTGKFRLMPRGELLLKDHPESIYHTSLGVVSKMIMLTRSHLIDAVKTGRTAFSLSHDGADIWEHIAAHPDLRTNFDCEMREGYRPQHISNLKTCMDGVNVLMDVGGCSGYLLSQLLEWNPAMECGILFDRPETIENAEKMVGKPGGIAAHVRQRMKLVAGDFFQRESIPDGADAVLLNRVIHDWSQEKSVTILRNVRSKLPPGGRLILNEVVLRLAGERSGNEVRNMTVMGWDLEVSLFTEEGQDRSEEEWRSLLRLGGFKLVKIIDPPPSGIESLLEAVVINDSDE